MKDKRKRISSEGIAGVFEDLPSFLIILIALVIFIACVIYSTVTYIKAGESNERYKACLDMLAELDNYEEILVLGDYTGQPIEGLYSFDKLNEMDTTQMKADVQSNYNYYVSIIDLKDDSISWSFGDDVPAERVEKITMFKIIPIEINENEIHTAQLKVTLW